MEVAAPILISAGESSGDLYAAQMATALRDHLGGVEFFGCAGDHMKSAGVRPVVDMASLAVVGLVEVLHHIPRIYGEYRRLIEEARRVRPQAALLVDSPDFNLRVAARLTRMGIPVYYFVAPQAWAWRSGRVKQLQRNVRELYCIFPFEEDFFRARGVNATYVGHPLSRVVRPSMTREEFFGRHALPEDRPLITICPGSRKGEAARHLAPLAGAAARIAAAHPSTFLLAAPADAHSRFGPAFFSEFQAATGARLVTGSAWDAMAHSDLTLAASGTVTVEAALLGAPMVTYYRVTPATWLLGRKLVDVPFFSMVNIVAGEKIVPELIQHDMTAATIAAEAIRLLSEPHARDAMRQRLARVAGLLSSIENPIEFAAARMAASIKEGLFT